MTIHEAAPPVPAQEEAPAPPAAPGRSLVPALLLVILLIVGGLFRFNGLDWDDGKLLHPDELHVTDVIANRIHAPDPRNLGLLLDPNRSPLNPRSVDPNPGGSSRPRQFAYGSLALFVTDFAGWFWGRLTDEPWNDFWRIFRVGRVMTVIADLITILLTYGMARRAFGTTVGLLAAACFALATMPVQLSHFFVTDTWTTTFVTAALWATLVAVKRRTVRAFALAGFLAGCAVATKVTVVIFGLPLLTAAWLARTAPATQHTPDAGISDQDDEAAPGVLDELLRFVTFLGTAGVAAFMAFFLFEPYAVLNPQIYLRDIGEQSAIISGRVDLPYTRQYIGTIPLLYQAKNLAAWELGPLLGAAVLIGLAWAIRRAYRRRDRFDLVLLAWVIPYLGVLMLNEVKFMRYLLPVIPVFCAYGAKLLYDLGAFRDLRGGPPPVYVLGTGNGRWADPRVSRRMRLARSWGATALTWLVIIGTFLTTLAFSAIYSRPHTQVAASDWIYANVPKGSRLSAEYWDHSLPLDLAGYIPISFDLYSDAPACNAEEGRTGPQFCDPNNEATLNYLIDRIHQTDYIIEATNRVYLSVPRLPWRYAVQQQYFALLFGERLGFEKVYDGTSFPTLPPFTFDDGFMDESFTVYDHPRVLIFKKTQELTDQQLRALFAPALAHPLSPTRAPKGPQVKSLLLPQPVDRLPAALDYAWNRTIGSNGLAALLLWLLTIELLGLLALPLVLPVCRRFPDRGWGLSKLAGWVIFAYPVWLGASIRFGRFTLGFLLLTLAIAIVLSGTVAYRRRDRYRAILRGAGPAVAVSEGVFLIAGLFFLYLRLRNPDLWHTYWGGEKPMELTHLNGILRSVNFPPYDPWFADGTINYYYYGQYLVAALVKLTGIPIEFAFNLAMPTISALIATAACSVTGALAGLALRRRPSRRAIGGFAVLGAILYVGIGNLDGAARLIGRLRDRPAQPLDFDFFWGGSRAIDGVITEFPYFTQVWADLHAHAIALPFTIMAIGVVVALALTPQDDPAGPRGLGATVRQLLPGLSLLGVTLGAIACTNLWDLPISLLVTAAGLFFAFGGARQRGVIPIVARLILAGAGAAGTGLLAYLLYRPFFANYRAIGLGGIARTRMPTPLPQFLDHFGLFVGIILVTLAAGFATHARRLGSQVILLSGLSVALVGAIVGWRATALTTWLGLHTRFFGRPTPDPTGQDPPGLTAAVLAVALVLLITLWIMAWGQLRLQLPLTLLIAGVGVALGPEIIFIADDLQGGDAERMNTIFKFYMQGWTLFALGGTGALAWVWDTAPRWSMLPFRRWRHRAERRFNAVTVQGLAAGFLAVLLAASFVYPIVGTPIRVATQFDAPAGLGLSLDGYRWMEYGTIPNERCEQFSMKDDYTAIKWLNANVVGSPVIAEASIGAYRGDGSRFAIATGLPTILGWDRHEYQQRPGETIGPRVNDVRALYNDPDEGHKLSILQRYHVSYVIVGAVERHWYLTPPPNTPCGTAQTNYASPQGLAVLEAMSGRYLTPAFQSGETTIYRVLPGAYSSGSAAGEPATAPQSGQASR